MILATCFPFDHIESSKFVDVLFWNWVKYQFLEPRVVVINPSWIFSM